MSTKYEICTELKELAWIEDLCKKRFEDGYSIMTGRGGWKGVPENAMTIAVVNAEPERVFQVAQEIKVWNQQDAVLVISTACETVYL